MDTSSGTLKFNTSVWHFDAVRWEVSITSGYRTADRREPVARQMRSIASGKILQHPARFFRGRRKALCLGYRTADR